MRSGQSQRPSITLPQRERLDGKTLAIADEYFRLSREASRENRRSFWLFAKFRTKRARRKALKLDGMATTYWRELLLRYRPLISNCFRAGGLTEDTGGGYHSAMQCVSRGFDIAALRVERECFAEILWTAVCNCVLHKEFVAEFHERFHLLALLDEFDSPHQGTIRASYFYQDGSWAADNDPNADLKAEELFKAITVFADFLQEIDTEVEHLTAGTITSSKLGAGNATDVLMAWL